MQYQRLEVNLLPPELQPAPTVRLFVILNIALLMFTFMYLVVFTMAPLYRMGLLKNAQKDLSEQLVEREPIRAMYNNLVAVKESVDKFGRIVSIASVGYVELPLLLDRISRIIPDGVFLQTVSNEKPKDAASSSIVSIKLATAKRDADLVETTLRAFKSDPIFKDSYMASVEYKEQSLDAQLAAYGVDWSVSGPDIPAAPNADMFEFEILANIQRPVPSGGTPVIKDYSSYLSNVEFKTPPPEGQDPDDPNLDEHEKPATDGKKPAAPPKGVTVKEVN